MSHDQNDNNVNLDYPHTTASFFAEAEARSIDAGARILPLREEQLVLGGDVHPCPQFWYLPCALCRTPARRYFDSPNVVARLILPRMDHEPATVRFGHKGVVR